MMAKNHRKVIKNNYFKIRTFRKLIPFRNRKKRIDK